MCQHTKNHGDRLLQAKALIGAERRTEAELREKLEVLATRRMRPFEIEKVVKAVFPKDSKNVEQATAQGKATLEAILERYEYNDNDAFPEIRGTAYNFLNAVTEYTDHFKTPRTGGKRASMTEAEVRSDNAMFGTGADFKRIAVDAILDATRNGKTRAIHRPLVAVPGGKQIIEIETEKAADSLLDSIIRNPQPKSHLNAILDKKAA